MSIAIEPRLCLERLLFLYRQNKKERFIFYRGQMTKRQGLGVFCDFLIIFKLVLQ
jgi:hypothetical protein